MQMQCKCNASAMQTDCIAHVTVIVAVNSIQVVRFSLYEGSALK